MNERRDFTIEELRVWYKPSTWFRKELVERDISQDPQLEGKLGILLEDAQFYIIDFMKNMIFL
ncbi:hypothetical protein CL617_03280 [archaeon]|nr:hypothetical protein [archaeon]|tara:strand:- start:1571 stop:1759 length:189 start_codon:yes stop_codon:yes gene_type:complete